MASHSVEEKYDIESVTVASVDQYAIYDHAPTLPSIPAGLAASRNQRTLGRTISITSGPAKIDAKAKIVGEFRTLRSVIAVTFG
jgi:hypothetical protein